MVDKNHRKGVNGMAALARKPKKKTRNDFDLWRGLVVRVIWVDPLCCEEVKESKIDKQPDVVLISYGEIIGKTSKNLTLASSIGVEPRDRSLREVLRIPVCLIKSVVLLEPTKEDLKL